MVALTLKDMAEKIKKVENEVKEHFNQALRAEAEIIFTKWPKLSNFSWTQYTPYFNDGEPCEFRMHDLHKYNYGSTDFGEYCDTTATIYDQARKPDWVRILSIEGADQFDSLEQVDELEEDLSDFIDTLKPFEKTVRGVLGEGEVIVSRDGVEVEEYSHD